MINIALCMTYNDEQNLCMTNNDEHNFMYEI